MAVQPASSGVVLGCIGSVVGLLLMSLRLSAAVSAGDMSRYNQCAGRCVSSQRLRGPVGVRRCQNCRGIPVSGTTADVKAFAEQ